MKKQFGSRAIMLTILAVALVQMPHITTTTAIDTIATEVFPERAFQTIQTIMALPNILSTVSGIIAAIMVRKGIATKKALVVLGLLVTGLTGVVSVFCHTEFWQLCLFSVMIGTGMGMFIPSAQSIVFDKFEEKPRQMVVGLQSFCYNIGGIIISVLGGILTLRLWYGGYLILIVTLPIALLSFIVLPGGGNRKEEGSGAKKTLPMEIYYYAGLILVYLILYFVGTHNISTQLAVEGIGDSASTGVAIALMMVGGAVAGVIFPKLSPIFRDNLIVLAYLMMFVCYTMLNVFSYSYAVSLAAMVICGGSVSFCVPYCIFRMSRLTEPSNSAIATMLCSSIAPGVGSFLSPVIMTNITIALGGESTRFRFQFTAVMCLVLAVLVLLNNMRRSRREKGKAVV